MTTIKSLASKHLEVGQIIERIAGVSDYQVAVETYRAAVGRWPGAKITLRNRARVIERSWED